jgi:hypothetical protein
MAESDRHTTLSRRTVIAKSLLAVVQLTQQPYVGLSENRRLLLGIPLKVGIPSVHTIVGLVRWKLGVWVRLGARVSL